MWNKGTLNIDGTEVKYWAKVLDHKSKGYGIEGGKIIKLELRVNGECTLNYDRGWVLSLRMKQVSLHTWSC